MLTLSTRKSIAFLLGYTFTITKSIQGFYIPTNIQSYSIQNWNKQKNTNLHMSTINEYIQIPKHWSELKTKSQQTIVGRALQEDQEKRSQGFGAPHVSNQLRLFDTKQTPNLTFYRDQAGWCPYCEKTILLIEEKRVPIQIQTVPMRSYGDKPNEFLQMVPNGLLPALVVTNPQTQRKQVITESQVIMELLDQWHSKEDGYLQMLPTDNPKALQKYDQLARLERELFSWWCTFLFRPESSPGGGLSGLFNAFSKNENTNTKPLLEMNMSSSMRGFVECLKKVDQELQSTPGPWFFSNEQFDHPTMIDFVYISHIERMLASSAYWKGFLIRGTGEFPGIDTWLDAFDQRESYLAFKSDFYTNVMDIPPQYGPGYYGGIDENIQEAYAKTIQGKDGKSWKLPLDHDEPLEPLYRGLPLPKSVLDAAQIHDYQNANPDDMAQACRHAAGWKLASNGNNVSRFAARGGANGAKNPRKTFAAQLADPYADPDTEVRPAVDSILQIVCLALLETQSKDNNQTHEQVLQEYGYEDAIRTILQKDNNSSLKTGIMSSLAYLRDRVGVPRDMPLAAARHFRAHLNWAIDIVEE